MKKILDKFRGDIKITFIGVAILAMILGYFGFNSQNVNFGGTVVLGMAGIAAILVKAVMGLVAGLLISIISKRKESGSKVIEDGFFVATAVLLLEIFAPLLNPIAAMITSWF